MMGVQNELCSFFSLSPKRQRKFTSIIQANQEASETRKTKIMSLSQTRWVERFVLIHY